MSDKHQLLNYTYQSAILLQELDSKNSELSKIYVNNMRKISLKFVLRISRNMKKTFCRNCNSLLIPKNSKFRIRSNEKKLKKIIITCENCNAFHRIHFKKQNRIRQPKKKKQKIAKK